MRGKKTLKKQVDPSLKVDALIAQTAQEHQENLAMLYRNAWLLRSEDTEAFDYWFETLESKTELPLRDLQLAEMALHLQKISKDEADQAIDRAKQSFALYRIRLNKLQNKLHTPAAKEFFLKNHSRSIIRLTHNDFEKALATVDAVIAGLDKRDKKALTVARQNLRPRKVYGSRKKAWENFDNYFAVFERCLDTSYANLLENNMRVFFLQAVTNQQYKLARYAYQEKLKSQGHKVEADVPSDEELHALRKLILADSTYNNIKIQDVNYSLNSQAAFGNVLKVEKEITLLRSDGIEGERHYWQARQQPWSMSVSEHKTLAMPQNLQELQWQIKTMTQMPEAWLMRGERSNSIAIFREVESDAIIKEMIAAGMTGEKIALVKDSGEIAFGHRYLGKINDQTIDLYVYHDLSRPSQLNGYNVHDDRAKFAEVIEKASPGSTLKLWSGRTMQAADQNLSKQANEVSLETIFGKETCRHQKSCWKYKERAASLKLECPSCGISRLCVMPLHRLSIKDRKELATTSKIRGYQIEHYVNDYLEPDGRLNQGYLEARNYLNRLEDKMICVSMAEFAQDSNLPLNPALHSGEGIAGLEKKTGNKSRQKSPLRATIRPSMAK